MRTVRSRLSKRQIVFLHTLKSKNNLSEEDYRYLLKEGAGVCSSTELDQDGLNQVLDLLEQIGLDVGDRKKPTRQYSYRKGMATPPPAEIHRGHGQAHIRARWPPGVRPLVGKLLQGISPPVLNGGYRATRDRGIERDGSERL